MHRYCGAIHQSNVVDHRAADPFESGSSDSTAAGRPTGRGDREAGIDCNNGFLAGHWLQEADPEADPVEIRNLIHTMIDGVVQLSGWMVFIQWSQSQLSPPAEGKYAPAIYT